MPGATDDVLGPEPTGGSGDDDDRRDPPPVPADRPDLEWDRVPDIDDVHAEVSDDLGEGGD